MAKDREQDWNWGQDVEKFPAGLWDDFDGEVEIIEYEDGDYGTQIHVVLRPREYEYDIRGQSYDPDSVERLPQGWYGLGGDLNTFGVSEDGLEITTGPAPVRTTRGVKFIVALRNFGRKDNSRLKTTGKSLKFGIGASTHFKLVNEKGRNPDTKEMVERQILYPSGPPIGHAVVGQTSKRGKSEDDSGEEVTTSTRRRRATATEEDEKTPPEESTPEETKEEGVDEAKMEQAFKAIVEAVGAAGEDGLGKRAVSRNLMHLEGYDDDVIELASQRTTITEAIGKAVIEEEDNKYYLPQKTDK